MLLLLQLLSSSLKMSARAASAMAAELIEFAGDKRAKFLHTLQKCPELWRYVHTHTPLREYAPLYAQLQSQIAMHHIDAALTF